MLKARNTSNISEKIIQLLVFEETNIKIYWCVKGDVDLCETPIIVLLLFCDKHLVDIGIEDKKSKWLVCSDKLLKDTEKE